MEFQEMQHLATIVTLTTPANELPALIQPEAGGGQSINYWSILHLLITILLCLVSLFVVLGNSLVVGAIWHENQLHSVTNYLIASLAVADCLVGLLVMPFSIISEIILGSWSFGATWCDLWHSFDVLASTASIMNLCAISLDRYLAITDPISYPARMTPKRVALLIVSLWTCSALISFPAIIWWRSVGQGPLAKIELPAPILGPTISLPRASLHHNTNQDNNNNISQRRRYSHQTETSRNWRGAFEDDDGMLVAPGGELSKIAAGSSAEPPPPATQSVIAPPPPLQLPSQQEPTSADNSPEQLYKCVFTDDTYYLLFSSFISFYGPLCVMLYAYYRIYKAAVKQMRFLKHGSKQVIVADRMMANGSHASFGGTSGETAGRNGLVLRVHRGGGGGAAPTGSNSLNLKSVLNKQSSLVTTTLATPSEPAACLAKKESLDNNNNHKPSGQVLYYESGKLFHKLTRLKEFSAGSVDANSQASTPTRTTSRGPFASLLPVNGGLGGGMRSPGAANGNSEVNSDVTQPTEAGEGEETTTNELVEQPNQVVCLEDDEEEDDEEEEEDDLEEGEPDNKPPEAPAQASLCSKANATNFNLKLYSNQHVIQIPSSHQSNCQQVGGGGAGSELNNADCLLQTPVARSHSTIDESSSLAGTITVGNTPQHQKQQQQQNRKVGRKLSRLAKERKAAKTLGIVVGVFILCWLPYFVVNITVGLCGSQCIIHLEIFMPIVTWLGWLNSAMNPVIYACWSREFRRAFRRVLCSWVIFFCPYGDSGQKLIKKLKLKDNSNYSSNTNATSSQQEAHSFSTISRPITLSNSLRTNSSLIVGNRQQTQTGSDQTVASGAGPNTNCIVTISRPLKEGRLEEV